jgi:hypothetical protein
VQDHLAAVGRAEGSATALSAAMAARVRPENRELAVGTSVRLLGLSTCPPLAEKRATAAMAAAVLAGAVAAAASHAVIPTGPLAAAVVVVAVMELRGAPEPAAVGLSASSQ